jgi:hypothetical protein
MLGRCKETNTILGTCPIKGHLHFMGQVVDPLARAPAVNTQQPLGGLLPHRAQVHQVNREVEAKRVQCSQGNPTSQMMNPSRNIENWVSPPARNIPTTMAIIAVGSL